ncbi:MAG: DUF1576 domain-containing protein [Spirochaetales bacterium]|nr:DUF1576 domain-containing protein [Spirochaetales bacterium]
MTNEPFIPPPSDLELDAKRARVLLLGLFAFLAVFGLVATGFNPERLLRGLGAIILSPDILINDYMSITGVGPAYFNAALCVLAALILINASRINVSGPVIAAVFTIAGFALFGKNIANIWPGFLGAFLYSRASRRPFGENIIVALFGTALAPLSSEIAFGLGIATPWNIAIAFVAGAVVGFLLSPVARHALDFHRGYNLYNIGFTAGLIGTVAMSGFKALDIQLTGGFNWAEIPAMSMLPYLSALFLSLIIAGMIMDRGWVAAYRRLLSSPGRLVSDFVRYYGLGVSLINMGIMGFIASAIMLLIGASWNGPMLGGLFTIVGFAAFGKHPRNTLPPMLGAMAMAMMSRYGLAAPGSQLAILFVSTVAPVAGEYGPVAGFVAGMLHFVLVQVVGTLHGGLNLYNNGFAGGLAAGLILPVLEWLREWRRHEI